MINPVVGQMREMSPLMPAAFRKCVPAHTEVSGPLLLTQELILVRAQIFQHLWKTCFVKTLADI